MHLAGELGLRTIKQVVDRELHPDPARRLTYMGKTLLDDDARVCLKYYDEMQVRVDGAGCEREEESTARLL